MVDTRTTRLNARTTARASQLTNDSAVQQVDYATIQPIHKMQQNGQLRFRLPGVKETLMAQAMNVEAEDLDNYTWYGEFEEDAGFMSFVATQGVLRGHIHYLGKDYEVHAVGDGLYVIAQMDLSEPATVACDVNEVADSNSHEPATHEGARVLTCTQTEVRLLALTTANARRRDPNFRQTIANAVSQFNTALSVSGATNRARLTLVGIENQNFGFVEDPIDIRNDVSLLRNSVNQRRDVNNADIVVLFTDGNYGTFGRVARIGPSDDDAYAIIEIDRATSSLTFTHEVGHLFGCLHQLCNQYDPNGDAAGGGCSTGNTFDHGYGYSYRRSGIFQSRQYKSTVMFQTGSNRDRQLRFSNPGIEHYGAATGTSALQDNARRIDQTATTVANFRQGGTLSASINGPTTVPRYSSQSWEVFIRCGTAPYTVNWEVSTDGFTYFPASSSQTYGQAVTSSQLYLRCRVRSADGQTRIAFRTVYTSGTVDDPFGRQGNTSATASDWISAADEGGKESKTVLLDAFPNPTDGNQVNVPFSVPESQSVQLRLINRLGQVVRLLPEVHYGKGAHQVRLDIESLPVGVYVYLLSTQEGTLSKRLIIKK